MLQSASAPPRFRAQFPVHLPSLSGGRFVSTIARILLIISPLIFLRACLVTYVAPDEIALRQISFGPSKGLQKVLVFPGYRRQIRGYETVRTFPRDVQAAEFTNEPTERGTARRTLGGVNVPTVDGYPVSVDVTVLYRLA